MDHSTDSTDIVDVLCLQHAIRCTIMNWTKAKDYRVALRNIRSVTPAELENSPVTTEELIDWATDWYLVALEARRIAVILENERKRRLRDYDTPNREPNRL